MNVTAEGVESLEVWEKLSSLGCDISQGYYSGPPMSSEDLVRSPFFFAPITADENGRLIQRGRIE
jgi:EAL domain-containing protein (putative c-di-GMP-specific phosphodiesterase class I)